MRLAWCELDDGCFFERFTIVFGTCEKITRDLLTCMEYGLHL
jgi:hypothetical protein